MMKNGSICIEIIEMKNSSSVNEHRHEVSNNVVCATSKGSDQRAHMRSLIRAFASRFMFYEC